MSQNLTPEQEKIKLHQKGNLLVSAGAGSGKTTILTKRIVHLIVNENVPLDRFLVLTFTNAAAQAMKDKVRSELRATETHRHLASQIDASFIMTFDAFALSLVKRYASELDLNASVSIFDQTLLTIEKRMILNHLFDTLAEKNDEGFKRLIGEYVVKNDQTLMNFIIAIDNQADLQVDKQTYLTHYIERYFSREHIQQGIVDLRLTIHHMLNLLIEEARAIENVTDRKNVIAYLSELNRFEKLDSIFAHLSDETLKYPRAQNNQSEEDKKVREKIKKQVDKLESLAGLKSEANAIEEYHLTRPYIETILTILIELNRLLDAKKKRLNAYSFADIGKMATRLMHDEQRRKTIQSMFDYIMIDEYQDTNDLQEAFIKLIAKDNIMMVGDIKQSIYRFRNANSNIFKEKLTRYHNFDQAEVKNNVTILLAKNYRSRSSIIAGVNSIFERIMSQPYGGVDYGLGQALQFGQKDYERFPSGTLEEGIETLWYEENPRYENAELQAELIANHLTHLMNQQATVVDEENGKKLAKPLHYRDVAILIDRKSKFKDYLNVFTERGIPLRIAADQSLSDSDFFRVFRNVMEVIAHFHGQNIQDIRKPLMSMLRSFLFEESDERLYLLMTGKLSFSDFSAYPIVRQLVKDRTTHTLSQLVAKVFHDFSFETKMLKIDDVAGNKARMLQLVALASNLEKQEYDLKQWITFMEQADDMDIDLLIGEDRSSDNAVTLMTIHKSKGLEFPVVYLPGTEAKFNIQELNANFLVSSRYGIMLPLPHSPYPYTFFRHLVRHQGKMDALSEYLRLFYVATTRAKEKLIFLQSTKFSAPLSVPFAYSFSDFIQLSQSKLIRRTVPSLTRVEPSFNLPTTERKTIEVRTVDFPVVMAPPKEIEKQFKEPVDSSVLDYGTYLHDLLFLVDFTTKDTSFITATKDRLLIDNILSLPLIHDIRGTVYKEYAYLDEATQRIGIMDMVIIDGTHATIVDYKTKDISNPSYDKQLERYRNYLLSQGFKTVNGYLISLIDGLTRVVF